MNVNTLVQQLGNWTHGKGPLHVRLATALEQAIEQGRILPGGRLPAERLLAEALALSRTTVLTAYTTLKTDGWIESRTGSGTWVSKRRASAARQQTHSAIVSGTSTLSVLEIDGSQTVDLAAGTTLPLTELPSELYMIDAEARSLLLADRSYMPHGLPQLRQAIASLYSSRGLPTSSDQVLVTSGAQQALSLLASLYVQRGDTVLVENPTYFGALDAFRLAGARLSPVPVSEQHVSGSMLRDRLLAVGPRLLYLTPTYQNPTGAVMPGATRECIRALADEFGIPIIEDHTLSELSIDGSPPGLISAHGRAGTVLCVGSMSKLFWAGLRVGWVRGPSAAIAQLARVKTATDLGSALLTQAIAAQLLTVLDQAKAIRREQLLRRRDLLAGLIRDSLPGWEFKLPPGGLFLWVRLPSGDARYFAQCAARHGVAITPGSMFSCDEAYADYLRIPFVLDEESLVLGAARLGSAWSEFRGTVNQGSTRIGPLV